MRWYDLLLTVLLFVVFAPVLLVMELFGDGERPYHPPF